MSSWGTCLQINDKFIQGAYFNKHKYSEIKTLTAMMFSNQAIVKNMIVSL